MKLKLDENLGMTAVEILRKAGHDAVTVKSQGLAGAKDTDVIAACRSEQRCLVTLDLEFANPLIFPPRDHHGIAVLRLPLQPSHADLLSVGRTLVAALERASIVGKLWVVQRSRLREYQEKEPAED